MSRGRKKFKQKDLDDQFDAFLKESISSDDGSLDTSRIAKYIEPRKKEDPWWIREEDEDEEEDAIGLSGTGSKFIKKRPKPTENASTTYGKAEPSMAKEGRMSRDSLDEESFGPGYHETNGRTGPPVPALSLGSSMSATDTITRDNIRGSSSKMGRDTLEEIEDKDKFFKDLERNSDQTIDYSQLNRELDKTQTMGATVGSSSDRVLAEVLKEEDENSEEEESYHGDPEDKMAVNRMEDSDSIPRNSGSKDSSDRKTMLSKVALMDSLESTVGTKPAASQDTQEDEGMRTIPETQREDDDQDARDDRAPPTAGVVKKHTRFQEEEEEGDGDRGGETSDDGVDGPRLGDDTEENKTTMTTGKGLTLKTGTGLAYTDTSREIEELHRAMRQVGMATLDDTRDFTLKDSSTQRTHDVTDEDGATGTGGFGLKPVAAQRSDRTIDDLMKEVEDFPKTTSGYPITDSGKRLPTLTEKQDGSQSFYLSPAQSDSKGFDVEDHHDDYDMSPFEKGNRQVQYLPDSKEQGEGSHMARREAYRRQESESMDGHRPIPAKRKPSPRRPASNDRMTEKQKSKDKLSTVKSSGYGQRASPAAKSSGTGSKQMWSPAELHRQKVKGTQDIRQVQRELAATRGEPRPAASPGAVARAGSRPGAKSGAKAGGPENQLLLSVKSFAEYIHSHFSSEDLQNGIGATSRSKTELHWSTEEPLESSTRKTAVMEREKKLLEEVKEWQEQWREERKMHAKVTAELAQLERSTQVQLEQQRILHEQDLFKLKQENFIHAAKVTEDGASDVAKRVPHLVNGEAADGVSKEQVNTLTKEVQEQEKLIAGYQQENERLYQEMKKIASSTKETEQRMFRENQKLSSEVQNLREELSRRDVQLRNKDLLSSPNAGHAVLGAGRLAHLDAELRQSKGREESLKKDVKSLQHTNKALEGQIEELVSKIEEFERKIKHTYSSKDQDSKVAPLERDVQRLNRKLKWYAENQELLDRDAEKLKAKDVEIARLKVKLSQPETGKKVSEDKLRTKERAADARRIQDLERQVREMENIVRKRHPNSLPVLMWAASNAADGDTTAPSVQFLENQVKKLEQELESRDDEAKLSLRVMEQKFNAMKFQYEARIESLEGQVSKHQKSDAYPSKEGDHPHSHKGALQRELDSVKERNRKRVAELEDENERLRRDLLSTKASKTDVKPMKEPPGELEIRIKALHMEVANQERDKQLLQKTIERLQKEKEQLVIDATRTAGKAAKAQAEKNHIQAKVLQQKATRGTAAKGKKVSPRENGPTLSKLEGATVLPPYTTTVPTQERDYEPDTFAGQHVSDILRENEELKQKLDSYQWDIDNQRVNNHKLLAETEARERRSRESLDDQVAALKAAHQNEIQRLLAENAVQHSTSKLAELQSKCDTQEAVLGHVRDQLSAAHVDRERLSVLQIRETTMESQVSRLMEELQEARLAHTPEMKHFAALQDKIRTMEARHAQRELELQQIIQQTRTLVNSDLQDELEHWKRLVEAKNRETDRFRGELDAILDVLKELQRQGVVLPLRGAAGLSQR